MRHRSHRNKKAYSYKDIAQPSGTMISILGNINMDPLQKYLPEGLAYFSEYNQYQFELHNPNSLSRSRRVRYVFIHLHADILFKPGFQNNVEQGRMERLWDEHLYLLKLFLKAEPDKILIITDMLFAPYYIGTDLNLNSPNSLFQFEYKVNQDLQQLALDHFNCKILEWSRYIKVNGYHHVVNNKGWYLGRVPYVLNSYEAMANELITIVKLTTTTPKKVLILDLDNTLWGGIVGEVGARGIELSEDGVGKAYRDFQRVIRSLKDIGVLLCICSKNNEADALKVFTDNSMMVLQWDDFVQRQINWENKVTNIQKISYELDLSPDSFVFIDDNPVERSQVNRFLSVVETPDFPRDPLDLVQWFYDEVVWKYFRRLIFTKEDMLRDQQYRADFKRKALKLQLDFNSFLRDLNCTLTVFVNPRESVTRLSQMTQKTNQFNLTTNRWSEQEIERFIQSEKYKVFAAEYEDRFGKEGIIALSIVRIENSMAIIEDLLMSCRVIGRNVEYLFLHEILNVLRDMDISQIIGLYRITKRNEQVKNLYPALGMTEIDEGEYIGDVNKVLRNIVQFQCYGKINFVSDNKGEKDMILTESNVQVVNN